MDSNKGHKGNINYDALGLVAIDTVTARDMAKTAQKEFNSGVNALYKHHFIEPSNYNPPIVTWYREATHYLYASLFDASKEDLQLLLGESNIRDGLSARELYLLAMVLNHAATILSHIKDGVTNLYLLATPIDALSLSLEFHRRYLDYGTSAYDEL